MATLNSFDALKNIQWSNYIEDGEMPEFDEKEKKEPSFKIVEDKTYYPKPNKDYRPKDKKYDTDYRATNKEAEEQTNKFAVHGFYKELIERTVAEDLLLTPDREDQLKGSDIQLFNGSTWIVFDEKAKVTQIGNEEEEREGKRKSPTKTFSVELFTGSKGVQYTGENDDTLSLGSYMYFSNDPKFKNEEIETDYYNFITINDADCRHYSELKEELINKITCMLVRPDDMFRYLRAHDVTDEKLYNDAFQKNKEFIKFYKETTEKEKYKTDPEYKVKADKEIEKRRRAPVDGRDLSFTLRDGSTREKVYYYFSFGKPDVVGNPCSLVWTEKTLEELPHTRTFSYDKREKEPFKEKDIYVNRELKEKRPLTKRPHEEKPIEIQSVVKPAKQTVRETLASKKEIHFTTPPETEERSKAVKE